MNYKEIKLRLNDHKILLLPPEKLDVILSNTEIIDDRDTLISDHIRILKDKDEILIQEITSKNELSIRIMNSIDEAEVFLEKRMETYEKMWDGCGCNVNYYE